MPLLVDSSVWMFALGTPPITAIVKYLLERAEEGSLVTTGMVRLEVALGAESWSHLLELQERFSRFRAYEPTSDTWDEAARLHMRMRKKGFDLKAPDLLIAAVALENGLTVLHADRDFEHLAKHEGLKTKSLLHLVG